MSRNQVALDQRRPEEALAELIALKGIGRWSAEIYLIFALGRDDVWPAADLGLQFGVAAELDLGTRLGERELRELGDRVRVADGAQ